MKAQAFHRIGGFDTRFVCADDFHFFMRLMSMGGRIGYLKQNLWRYRIRHGSLTSEPVNLFRHQRDVWIELKNTLPFTAGELQTIDKHIAAADAAMLRAEGRRALLKGEWPVARNKFDQAFSRSFDASLPLRHRALMAGVCTMLRLYPPAVRHAAKKLRPEIW